MDPFAKKMIRGSFAFAAVMLLMFAALTVVYLHLRPRCSDQIISSAISPDEHWKAAVMEARCGESEPFLTHVNIRPANESIKLGYFSGKAEQGEVFAVEQDAVTAGVQLTWNDATHLTVLCMRCLVIAPKKREERWNNVQISYAPNKNL